MERSWDFLEPWRAVLSARMHTPRPTASAYSLRVNFILSQQPDPGQMVPSACYLFENSDTHQLAPGSSPHHIAVHLPVGEASRQNPAELRLFREALELFTILYRVNYNAFKEIVAPDFLGRPTRQLAWSLWPVGGLPNYNKTPLTWGDLLGFTADWWTDSPEFLSAMRTLATMCGEQADEMYDVLRGLQLSWTCVFPAFEISGLQESGKGEDSRSTFSHRLRDVMDLCVPPIARHCVNLSGNLVDDTRRGLQLGEKVLFDDQATSTSAFCRFVAVLYVDLTQAIDLMEMAVVLASTANEILC
jgi:hypothetical protein